MSHPRARDLVKQLDHPRIEVRRSAADDLVALGPDAEPALSEELHRNGDIKVRRRILPILSEMDVPKAIPSLMAYVLERPSLSADDTRPLAMRAWIHALAPKHRKHCFDVFVQLRRDQDAMVRAIAMEGLAKLGDARAIRFLEEVSRNDADDDVRATAKRMLATFRVTRLETEQADEVYSTEALVYKLASRDAFQRELGIAELLKDENAFTLFADAASSPHGLARKSGIIGLGELRDPAAYRILLSISDSAEADADERALALRAMSTVPVPEHFDHEVLLRQLERHIHQREDVFRVTAALGAIMGLNHEDSATLVASQLDDSEPWVRESAAAALADAVSLNQREVLPLVGRALRASGERSQRSHDTKGGWPEDEIVLQEKLLEAAQRLSQPGDGDALDLVPIVLQYLAHPRAEIRRASNGFLAHVAQAPGDLGPSELRVVLGLLGSRQRSVRHDALDILERTLAAGSGFAAPRLASLSYDNDDELVLRVIPLLARTGDLDAQHALARLANHADAKVAQAAREALLEGSNGIPQ